ncbi:MAG TPA: hypothetical protein VFK56_12825, partial [Mycobacterium sp.]|nr:hypothetical protein [Mycobacterium sp.]
VIQSSMIKASQKITADATRHAAGERADAMAIARAARDTANASRAHIPALARIERVGGQAAEASRRVTPALSRIEGVERGNAGRLQAIANKKSSVVVNLTAISQISIRALAGNLNTNNYTTVTGRRGGALV